MRTTQRFFYLIVMGLLCHFNASTQVTEVEFFMNYDTTECRHDFNIIVTEGSATFQFHRIQLSAQYSVVTPAGVFIAGAPINHMPLQNNQTYTGTVPTIWSVASSVLAPAADPAHNFYGITPAGTPTSLYNDIATGDTIRLFSLNFTEVIGCGDEIRIFRNPTFPDGSTNPNGDPPSSAPGMGLADFSNGFTMGGSFAQLYNGTAQSVGIPPISASATTTCSNGLEIDLSVNGTGCQAPYTYAWEGPNYTGTEEDVMIPDSQFPESGNYSVTVTGNLGCQVIYDIDAEAKPQAGPNQDGCANSTLDIAGTSPTTGTWSSMSGNDPEATLTPGTGGMASISFSSAASGTYDYIYSTPACSDTMTVNIIAPDAGPDPSNVNCYSLGATTITADANQTGTWSLAAGSAGTAVIDNDASNSTIVNGFSDPGTYYFVWTVGPCTDTVEVTTTDNCGCPITNNLIPSPATNSYCESSGIVSINANEASPIGGLYLWEYNMNGGTFTAAVGVNNTQDYNTQDLPVGVHNFRRIYETITDFLCKDTSNVVSFEVFDTPSAPIDLQATPNPVCLGNNSTLSVTNNPDATYTWSTSSADAGLILSSSNTAVISPTAIGVYDINVTQTVNGCESPVATISVTVEETPIAPNQNTVFGTDPSACAANDGSIRFVGLTANTSFTIEYNLNGSPQSVDMTSNPIGEIIISNLGGGTYSDFVLVSSGGCPSDAYAGPITLSEPDAPAAPNSIFATPNPECMGLPIVIKAVGEAGAIFTWTADSPDAGLQASTVDSVIMTSFVAGFYSISVTQTVDGCVSDATTTSVSVTEAPPTPIVTGQNPTVCGGSDGTATIPGLNTLTTYTVNYDKNGNPVSADIQTNTSGELIITGLTEGSYSNFTLTNFTGCESGAFAGPISLSDPGSPDAPADLTGVPNPVCLGTDINLSVTNNPNATYTWSASSPDAGLVIANGNTTTMDPSVAGTYTISVSQSVAGCTSPTATIDIIVGDTPSTPTSPTALNPVNCGGSDGSISFDGYAANAVFTVDYDKNGTQVSTDITSTSAGMILIPGLTAGSYTDFQVTNNANCSSAVFAGPVDLMDPNAPDAPTGIAATPNPVCAGETVNLSVDANPGATYDWSISSPDGGIVASTTNTTIMVPTVAGTYTISVLQNVAGCLSPVSTIDVIVNANPPTPTAGDITVINPSNCGEADGEFSISGYEPNTAYNLDYTFAGTVVTVQVNSNTSGDIFVTNLSAGSYTNIITTNPIGCISGVYPGPISLSDPGSPDAPSNIDGVPNPVCIGNNVLLSVLDNPNATYNWTASSPDAGLVLTSSSNTIMSASAPGTYTINVTQTVDGCISPAATIVIIVNAIPPTLTDNDIISTDPLICGINDGQIRLTGLDANIQYQVEFSHNGSAMVNVIESTVSGEILIENLQPGTYTNFKIISPGGCESGVYAGPIILDGPDVPPSPTGITGVPNPVCFGNEVNLSVDDKPNVTYTWSAPTNAGLVTSTTSSTTMNALVAGTYTISVTESLNGCESPAATIEIQIIPNPITPSASTIVVVEPSCGGQDGSITLTGNAINTDFIISYSLNNQLITENIVSNDLGELLLDNIGAGIYSNFLLEGNGGCTSDVYPGPIEVEEPCAGSIGSYVWHDQNGNGIYNQGEVGIEGVIVNLFTDQGVFYESTLTDETGYYLIENVLSGDYYIEFIPLDIYDPTFPNVGDELNDSDVDDSNGPGTTANFSVVSNQDLETVKAGYYVCSRIGDNVWYDINENDIYDGYESGIDGLKVNLWRKHNGTWILWETTKTTIKPETNSDDGWYEFCSAPGEYYVEIIEPLSGLVLAKANVGSNDLIDSDFTIVNGIGRSFTFSLLSGQDKLNIGAGYYPEAVAGNLVWMDANYNGLQDYNEERVEGVTVQAYNAITQTLVGESVTDENGVYNIEEIQKMDIYLKFELPAGFVPTDTEGGNNQKDSDVDHSNGPNTTRTFSMSPGEYNEHIDFGVSFAPLPAEWLLVEVNKGNDNHIVNWKMAQEINVSHYEVERRLEDENDFYTLPNSNIEAKNSLLSVDYNFVDNDIKESSKYYYRVKQVDRDGTYEYSEVVSIENLKSLDIRMYPNPASSLTSFEFSSKEEGDIIIELFNADGKRVKQITHTIKETLTKEMFDIDVTDLPQGVYNTVVQLNNNTIRQKLVILK